MESKPYFSIIIPMYNSQKHLKICVDSILNQTFKDFEIIIIDDMSTDNSVNIYREFYGDNEKVMLLCQEKNQGPGMARNRGIETARGEYIFFVDSDDVIVPDALEKLYKATQIESEIDVIHMKGWYQTAQVDDKPLDFRRIFALWEENPKEGFLTDDIPRRLSENWVTNKMVSFGWLYAYRRKFLEECGIEFPVENIYSEDHPFIIAGMCFAKKYFLLRDALTIYRVHEKSLMHNTNVSYCIRSMPVLVKSYIEILDRVPQLKGKDFLKEQCIIVSLDNILSKHARPLYDGLKIDKKLDAEVYESMLPIFGENTIMVKYLFHGFNAMYKQVGNLSRQLETLRKREELFKKQNQLIEQLKNLLNQYER